MPNIDMRTLAWHCPPTVINVTTTKVSIETLPETDFWQRTHYGFRRDNGHFLCEMVGFDFDAELTVRIEPNAIYDQAGLMVRCSASSWLKTSCEYAQDEPAHLGAVVTNAGYSDWSYQPVSNFPSRLSFRVSRRRGDYEIALRLAEAPFDTIRIAHLLEDDGRAPVQVGPYACSPQGAGCPVTFSDFSIVRVDQPTRT